MHVCDGWRECGDVRHFISHRQADSSTYIGTCPTSTGTAFSYRRASMLWKLLVARIFSMASLILCFFLMAWFAAAMR